MACQVVLRSEALETRGTWERLLFSLRVKFPVPIQCVAAIEPFRAKMARKLEGHLSTVDA